MNFAGQPIGIHSLVAGSLLGLVGYQVGSFGLLSDMATNPVQAAVRPADDGGQDPLHARTRRAGRYRTVRTGAAVSLGLLYQWVFSGFTDLPSLRMDIVAFTEIVVGMQTVFGSFFGSLLLESRQ